MEHATAGADIVLDPDHKALYLLAISVREILKVLTRMRIWLRQRIADLRHGARELVRRQLRKLIEIALSDLDLMARFVDPTSSVAFEAKHLSDAASFKGRVQLYRWVLGQVPTADGLFLEFGVYKGDSINRLAELEPDVTWYGFDSFVGLPEAWTLGAKTGAFSTHGALPVVRDNVRLVAGFFEDSLPGFVAEHGAKVSVLHVDADLYSSTVTILENLKDRLVPGSIIIFDELINYPGWQNGEYKAFTEYVERHHVAFEYLAYVRTASQVAVRLTGAATGVSGVTPPARGEIQPRHAAGLAPSHG
jgi:hypothetical protein